MKKNHTVASMFPRICESLFDGIRLMCSFLCGNRPTSKGHEISLQCNKMASDLLSMAQHSVVAAPKAFHNPNQITHVER
jgi:hypothetical protein